jgi:hypothetical protein
MVYNCSLQPHPHSPIFSSALSSRSSISCAFATRCRAFASSRRCLSFASRERSGMEEVCRAVGSAYEYGGRSSKEPADEQVLNTSRKERFLWREGESDHVRCRLDVSTRSV